MPQVSIEMPFIGNRWAVGLAFQVHLIIVAAIMGAAILAPTAEFLGYRRGDERYARLARDLAHRMVQFFSIGATWAVLALVFLFGLYPTFFGILTSIFFWPMVAIPVLWVIMTLSVYYYYYSWTAYAGRRGLHLLIGSTFAGSTFLFISTVIFLSSYMLTPTSSDPLAAALNPSWPGEFFHRHIGNLSYVGLIVAGYAGLRFIAAGANQEERKYFDWLGSLGLLLGVGLALLQPIVGWYYAYLIQGASPGAFRRMMTGENSWLFLIQTFLLAAIFLLGNFYLASTASSRGPIGHNYQLWMSRATWAVAALGLLSIIPQQLPLGSMTPWKYIGLGGMVLFTLVDIILYIKGRRTFRWGEVPRRSQLALIGISAAAIGLMIVMGTIRESARGGDLVYGRMGAEPARQIEGSTERE